LLITLFSRWHAGKRHCRHTLFFFTPSPAIVAASLPLSPYAPCRQMPPFHMPYCCRRYFSRLPMSLIAFAGCRFIAAYFMIYATITLR